MKITKLFVTTVAFVTTVVSVNGTFIGRDDEVDSIVCEYRKAILELELYKKKATKVFDDYRVKVNEDFAEALKEAWEIFPTKRTRPIRISPLEPVIIDNVKDSTVYKTSASGSGNDSMLLDKSGESTFAEDVYLHDDKENTYELFFYGTPVSVSKCFKLSYSLKQNDPVNVGEFWKSLGDNGYLLSIVDECQNLKKILNVGDWGYYRLVSMVADKISGNVDSDTSRVISMFILANSGYVIRIGQADGRLQLLLPVANDIPNWSYVEINGLRYYVVNSRMLKKDLRVFRQDFPGNRILTLNFKCLPCLNGSECSSKIELKGQLTSMLTLEVNKNIINYLNDIPVVNDLDMYAEYGLSDGLKAQLYPALRLLISGKDDRVATNMLLEFVQRSFKYKSDNEQFGYERPLFADESFFYPYNDCEDRSILFAVLVKDLLHHEVVLLDYPNHVATAVCLPVSETDSGDKIWYSDKEYIICDPTYIGSVSGQCMPEYKNVSPTVIRIQ